MLTARVLSGIAILAGLALIAWAGVQGDLSVHLVLVIPVVSGSGPAAALGMLLAMGGLVGWVLTGVGGSTARSTGGLDRGAQQPEQGPEETESSPATETRGGGVILLGPIPIAWGNDRESLLAVLVAAIVLILVALGAWVVLTR